MPPALAARNSSGRFRVSIRVGINGFGRIGRNFFRAAVASDADIEVVGINDLTQPDILAHFLKYNTTQGRFGQTVEVGDGALIVGGKEIAVSAERDPADPPWG